MKRRYSTTTQYSAARLIRKLAMAVATLAVISAIGTALALAANSARAADPEVTYCIDLRTNEIKVVAKGMPCPFPTTQM